MAVEFIYDENLHKAKKDLTKVVETINRTPLNKRGLFLRRFFFACVKAVENIDRGNMLQKHKEEFKKIPIKRTLPHPPTPKEQMIPLPSPPEPEF